MKNIFWVYFIVWISLVFKGFSQNEAIEIVNLKVNDENNHFAVSYLEGNKIVFTSNLLNKRGKQKLINGTPQLTLYQGEINEAHEIVNVSPLPYHVDSSVFNLSASTFYTTDKKYIVITTNVYNTERKANLSQKASKLKIEIGEYVEGIGWTNFKVPSFCDSRSSYGHPAISPDGKYMYFVSTMRGTLGGTDIFRVAIHENNTFGTPENLGLAVNTRKKELFPFISKDNVLYFSSNRPKGKGKMDIYKSQILEDGTFAQAELLEAPINSRFDDYSYLLNDDLESGYFSSARLNGKGGDDLYYFFVK
ncbi:TolB family protein [Lacinutrix gracilariae]|uniref:TolB family protein n=1 Tax=Lacinutrix gracilariae TaxID=1747198 RepID=A0ABW5K0Q9_9FLAO